MKKIDRNLSLNNQQEVSEIQIYIQDKSLLYKFIKFST